MPGPIVHLHNVHGLRPYLLDHAGGRSQELADLIAGDPCSPYLGLGAQGPDFLLFSLKEYGTPLDEFVNFIFGVYDTLEPFIDFYRRYIQPIADTIEDAALTLDKVLFNGLFSDLGATVDQLGNAVLTKLAKAITSNVDLFYFFYPKLQQGLPEDQWYWFDTWHYRRTGRLCSTMWQLAQGDDDLMRYAIGYGSHIGADVAGHPFINSIVGGPYRSFWHRHHLVENWIDAYARKTFPDDATVQRCLRLGGDDHYVADAISGSYYYRLCEFPGGRLPRKLANLLVAAVDDTYSGTVIPPTLTASDFDATYRLWLLWFQRTTSLGSTGPPTPVPPPGGATTALFKDFVDNFPPPPNFGGGGGFSLGGLFAAIFETIRWLVDAATYIAGWITTHIDDIFALPLAELLALAKWLLYLLRKLAWEIYDEARFALVVGAYMPPEPRDFAKAPWNTAFINTASAHLTGGGAPAFLEYPHKQDAHGPTGPINHHLLYPTTALEADFAESAPEPFFGQNPDVFLTGQHPYMNATDNLYNAHGPYGDGPDYTHWVDEQTWSSHQFGSMRAFTARLLADRIAELPNFNLDCDRGYGWKTWVPHAPDLEAQNPLPVDYIDP